VSNFVTPPEVPTGAATAAATRRGYGLRVAPPDSATILVADDEAILQRLIRRVLERAGFGVVAVGDGDAALEALAADPARFAAVVLDVTMPPHGGEVTLERMLALRSDLSVVLVSGAEMGRSLAERLRACGGQFLPKPFAPDALLDAVRAAAENAEHAT
jgi:two-component system cell cycle sensor histidine kinase/response regulator CckA